MAVDPGTIIVVSAADSRYALPLAVMLSSVGSALGEGIALEAHVLDDGVGAEDKRRVEASAARNTRIHWIRSSAGLEGLPVWGRMPPTTYQKILLADWAPPDVERAVWLDCDILALEDISPLWRTRLDGAAAAAVQDHRVPCVSSRFGVGAWRELGLAREAKYFNAGVLVIDLNEWRRLDVRRRALGYLDRYGERVYFWDQEALNATLSGRWVELEPKWNQHPSLEAPRGLRRRPRLAPARSAAPREGLIHFCGGVKPWERRGRGAAYALYPPWVDRTPWAGARPAVGWTNALQSWYESSRLRRWLYPAEQFAVMAQRAATRRWTA